MVDRQTIRGTHSVANPEFRGSVRAENGGEVFVYDGELGLDETGAAVVARGPNVVLEVIGPAATARRDHPGPSQTAGGHGAIHVELRPGDALRLAALLAQHDRHAGSG